MPEKRIKWLVLAVGLITVIFFASNHYLSRPEQISTEKYQQILDEIMGVEFVFRNPTPDHGGSTLAYVHGAEIGRGLYLLDLNALERMVVPMSNEVSQVNGWSPDDRYLAFVQTPPPEPHKKKVEQSWLTLWDRTDNSVRRLTTNDSVIENYFFWLTTNSYLFVTKPATNPLAASEVYLGSLDRTNVSKISNYMPELLVLSSNLAGYAYKGNIFDLKIKELPRSERWGWDDNARVVRQLSHWTAGEFDQIKWLRYRSHTSNFLFCARPTNSTWRYLYEFNPRENKLTRLSEGDTYNGQYVQGGRGFAYVGNSNNSFFLTVRPENPNEATNLFTRGSVVNYTGSSDGNRIYVTASQGVEPQGLWEYNVANRSLRRVVDGMSDVFVASTIVEPEEKRIKSFDGLEIPCFFFSPANLDNDLKPGFLKTGGTQKYPLVIFLSPRTGQFQRSFDARSQLLANLGFYFVAVNYRGCDGYGRNYSDLANTSDAAKDILAIYNELMKNPMIDSSRVFLSSSSDGSQVAEQLLAERPNIWRGVSLENPTAVSYYGFDASRLPPIFFSTGDQDGAAASLAKLEEWGKESGVDISSVVYTNSGHITYKTSQRKDKLDRVAKFFIRQL